MIFPLGQVTKKPSHFLNIKKFIKLMALHVLVKLLDLDTAPVSTLYPLWINKNGKRRVIADIRNFRKDRYLVIEVSIQPV